MWAVAALLTACGGGGGGSGSPAPAPGAAPPPGAPAPAPADGGFNVNAAWQNFLRTSQTWDTLGVADDTKTYSIKLSVAPTLSSVFAVNGVSYSTSEVTVVSGIQGLGLDQSVSRSYYDPATFKLAGTRNVMNSDPATCSVVTATDVPPTSAEVGDDGDMQTFDDLQGCSAQSAKSGTSRTTWSLEQESGTTYFCLNTTARDLTATVLQTDSECVEVSKNGDLGDKARITVERPGFSLTTHTDS
jgi:hypothetical protein